MSAFGGKADTQPRNREIQSDVLISEQAFHFLRQPNRPNAHLLATQVLPHPIEWAGAIISTVITGLTIYQYAAGLNAKRKKAHILYVEIGKYIADYRDRRSGAAREYWSMIKQFEGDIRRIEYSRED